MGRAMWQFLFEFCKQRGQVSLFMALIFPILFVFFAMTINLGLLVHDKINLQNSVDLAAYYGASKQAEILNAIAHINYQIRQSWKLLAFRVRGFGDMGRGREWPQPPAQPPPTHPWSQYSPDPPSEEDYSLQLNRPPSICTQMLPIWRERFFGDTAPPQNRKSLECNSYRHATRPIVAPRPILFIAGGFNRLANQFVDQLRQQQTALCEMRGISNWLIGAWWITRYQLDIKRKRKAIEFLAEKLEKGDDLSGQPIEDGVQRTLRHNLTRSNRDAFEFKTYNSMDDVELDQWLAVRGLYPVIYYIDTTSFNKQGGCANATPKTLQDLPEPNSQNAPTDPSGNLVGNVLEGPYGDLVRTLSSFVNYPQNVIGLRNSDNPYPVIGYEKNPWYMVYYGVSATAQPKEPFSPFVNDSPTLKARAFAKPFGGRVGPWMFESWGPGFEESQMIGQQTDPLLPLFIDGETDPNQVAADTDLNKYVPNYSRFPGDSLGLRSRKALGVYKGLVNSLSPPGTNLLSYEYFSSQIDPFDTLMWDNVNSSAPPARVLEVLAVAPDLFDITYYSIDPQFFSNYQAFIQGDFWREAPRDFGARLNGASPYTDAFAVFDQIYWANGQVREAMYPNTFDLPAPPGEWIVKSWKHLLTGWVPDMHVMDRMSEDSKLFGRCHNDDEKIAREPNEPIPGSCGVGGRTGYSVKLVSKKYLQSKDLALGGPNGSSSSILNDNIPDDF